MTLKLDRASILLSQAERARNSCDEFGLIILNQPITDIELLKTVWGNAKIVACADGGANRLHDCLSEAERPKFKPDFIAGDLDSLTVSTREYYETLGVPIVHNSDQNSTDFDKCLDHMEHELKSPVFEKLSIVAFGATGGRVDQIFHSIHQLFKLELVAEPTKNLTLLSDDSLTFLIPPGEWEVNTPRSVLGPTCGLIPITGESVISTDGLVWDVKDWTTSYASRISTSNAMARDSIFVKASNTILFTMEIRR
ncbi:thiamine pyrophosphokinase [Dipodascopsis tothii]|uniref:thiamine pyrophosphokinase n=1 Tax=Dipodascopsis tothii TaxID=44089 RepID=UPI0034CD3023